ncbi:MAG: DTW domain-containing protein [Burkholderiales bacterium]|nr:DTW domain-containing protein [Burkholderiales bacterium]
MSARTTCPRCLLAQVACICPLVTPTAHASQVLILQHPLETHHAKNSARLLHLSLPGSRVLVGETFDEDAWQVPASPRYTVLLYPPTHTQGHAPAATLDPAQLTNPAQVRLIVLDATWRKSRKMLHQSPALQRLPRLALTDVPPPRYAIRKAHLPGQLSTLEATCAALAQLEGNAAHWQALLAAFDQFVAQRQAFAS